MKSRPGFDEYIVRGSADVGGGEWFTDCSEEDAAFIAATNPETIRSLVEEIKAWRFSSPYTNHAPPYWPIRAVDVPDTSRMSPEEIREKIAVNLEIARHFDAHGPDCKCLFGEKP